MDAMGMYILDLPQPTPVINSGNFFQGFSLGFPTCNNPVGD